MLIDVFQYLLCNLLGAIVYNIRDGKPRNILRLYYYASIYGIREYSYLSDIPFVHTELIHIHI